MAKAQTTVKVSINLIKLPNNRPCIELEADAHFELMLLKGEKITYLGCAKKWQWSRTKVKKFLKDTKRTLKGHQETNINNSLQKQKDIKKTLKRHLGKIEYSDYVRLKKEEYDVLVSKYGQEFTDKCITKLDNYIPNKQGKPYIDHYRVMKSWVIDQVKRDQNGKQHESKHDRDERIAGEYLDAIGINKRDNN